MNKRRMKYKYWDKTRTCLAILSASSIFCSEVPPGGVFYGPTNGRGDDTIEGKGLFSGPSPDIQRSIDISYAGRNNLPCRGV